MVFDAAEQDDHIFISKSTSKKGVYRGSKRFFRNAEPFQSFPKTVIWRRCSVKNCASNETTLEKFGGY